MRKSRALGRAPEKGALTAQRSQQLVDVRLLLRFGIDETDAHAEGRVGGPNRTRYFNGHAARFEYEIHLGVHGEGIIHLHIATVEADIGKRSPHVGVAAPGAELRTARTAKPRAQTALSSVRGSGRRRIAFVFRRRRSGGDATPSFQAAE